MLTLFSKFGKLHQENTGQDIHEILSCVLQFKVQVHVSSVQCKWGPRQIFSFYTFFVIILYYS